MSQDEKVAPAQTPGVIPLRYRGITEDGRVVEAFVEPYGEFWRAYGRAWFGEVVAQTPRAAALKVFTDHPAQPIAEILAPGEMTRTEAIGDVRRVTRERDEARARCRHAGDVAERAVTTLRQLRTERDEARALAEERDLLRAEVERLEREVATPSPSDIRLVNELQAAIEERNDARAEVERLRGEVARAHAEGFALAVARSVVACDDEEAAGVAERARLVGEPRHQLYDLSRQEGRYHAANRLRWAINALRPGDAEAAAVIESAVRQNEEVQRAEVGAAVAAEREACAAVADSIDGMGARVLAAVEIAAAIRARGEGGS